MKIVKVPGVNGLGRTAGVIEAPDKISKDGEKIEINLDDISEQLKQIYSGAKKALSVGNAIFIGGDHSISYPIGKAFYEKVGNPCIVIFDAHPDCMPPLREPNHEEWLRGIVDLGLDGERVLLISSRKEDKVEIDYMNEKGIKRISVEHVGKNFDDVLNEIKNHVDGRDVYISVDIDALDPKIMPATGCPVSEGLTKEELIDMINAAKEGNFECADLVEYNPWKDEDKNCLKIVREILNVLNGKS